jgi:hypothetical protein
MKNIIIILAAILFVLLFGKCTSKSKDAFPNNENIILSSEDITSDSILINEIIDVNNWISIDNQIIIQTSVIDTFFFSYLLPDWQIYSTFGRKGQGPQDYLFPQMATDGNKKLYIYDNAKHDLVEYVLLENKFIIKDKIKNRNPVLIDKMLNIDEITFFIKENTPNEIKFKILANKNNELIKLSDFVVESDLRGDTPFNDFVIANYKKYIATAYIHKNQICLYQIKENNKIKTLTDFTKETEVNKDKYFYTDLCCNEKYIYALYQGLVPNLVTEQDRSAIIIYNWSGEAIKKLNLDRIINKIIIDRHSNYIYAISPYESDYIYKYRIKTGIK